MLIVTSLMRYVQSLMIHLSLLNVATSYLRYPLSNFLVNMICLLKHDALSDIWVRMDFNRESQFRRLLIWKNEKSYCFWSFFFILMTEKWPIFQYLEILQKIQPHTYYPVCSSHCTQLVKISASGQQITLNRRFVVPGIRSCAL